MVTSFKFFCSSVFTHESLLTKEGQTDKAKEKKPKKETKKNINNTWNKD